MAWDFSTEPEFQAQLDWMRDLVRDEVWPIETVFDELGEDGFKRAIAPLQERVKERGLWAAHLPPELGGQGFGQVKLGLMHEILGTSPVRARRVRQRRARQRQQRDPRARGHAGPEGALPAPAAGGRPAQRVLDDRAARPRAATRRCCRRARSSDGDEWVINGHKWFSTNGSIADFLIVMAVTDPDARPHQRASMFLVDVDTPGVNIIRDVADDGAPGASTFGRYGGHAEIVYEDVRVPADALLGGEGEGFLIAQHRLGPGRIHHCMRWLGVSQRAFDMLCERACRATRSAPCWPTSRPIQNWVADSAGRRCTPRG